MTWAFVYNDLFCLLDIFAVFVYIFANKDWLNNSQAIWCQTALFAWLSLGTTIVTDHTVTVPQTSE